MSEEIHGDHTTDELEIFRLMVSAVKEYAIFMLDPNGNVMTWNEGAQRIKGYSADEIVGKHFSAFYTESAQARKHPDYELQVAKAEGRYEEEGWRVRKDRSLFWANVVITPIYRDGALLGFAKVTRDLTEKRKTELEIKNQAADLQRVNDELLQANSAKDVFLATMSHELRTPLNSIIGFNSVMLMGLSGTLNETQTKQATYIKLAAQHLLSLINDILDLAKIESGKLELELEPVELCKVAQDVCRGLEPLAADRNLFLKPHECAHGQRFVRGNERAIRQILTNLISNAVKFTDTGGVTVRCTADDDTGGVHIEDTGIGISLEDGDKLFQGFVQLARANRKQEGTGLGLALSQRLAHLMGGRITFVSESDKGSTFTFVLPLCGRQEK